MSESGPLPPPCPLSTEILAIRHLIFPTHCLARAAVAVARAPLAENVAFADQIDPSGQLAFDSRVRPGVVERSNALALMRAVGLDV